MKIWRQIKHVAEKIRESEFWCMFFHGGYIEASDQGHYVCQKPECTHVLRQPKL